MTFKIVLFVCGLIFSIQNAYCQVLGLGCNGVGYNNGLGLNNAFVPSYGAVSYGDVDITAIDIDSTGYGAAYGYGGLGNAGAVGLEAAGLGLGNVGIVGLGAAGLGLGNAGALGIGATGLGNVGLGGLANVPFALGNTAYPDLGAFSAGGYFPTTSFGPIVPAGLTVVSDNNIQGAVAVEGQLPFLSAVAFEGAFPSTGSGFTQCGCGSAGNIGIISESIGPVSGIAGVNGLGLAGLGLGGLAGRGLIL